MAGIERVFWQIAKAPKQLADMISNPKCSRDRNMGNGKTLLVDDEPFALSLLAHQLTKIGLTDVCPFESGMSALAELESDPTAVDLVFCDLQMPGMDGVEFVRHLARIEYPGRLVLVSGENRRILQTVQRLAEAQQIDVVGVIHKPTTLDQLSSFFDRSASKPLPLSREHEPVDPADLDLAIRDGELVNNYQPKVSLTSGRLVGVETLVRWEHPSAGMVFPDRFVAVAEQHGLIDALTRNVLDLALNQSRQWLDEGIDLHIAVNISMDNLADVQFADWVAWSAADAGVPLANLVLEVTESRLMNNPITPLDILTRLRLRHVGLSIDDFGTGHSSIAQLRDIPFSELKIDRSFVHGVGKEPALRSIVAASLSMARQFGTSTVAEGVEDRDDWDSVRNLGCDVAQGYFIGKPMPAQALPGWIEDWEDRRGYLVA
jgi:EAL domain-containing protein (putative c-di-GMP-specific phosphodiesterase class I)/ActR/RegA family two-component response regulator